MLFIFLHLFQPLQRQKQGDKNQMVPLDHNPCHNHQDMCYNREETAYTSAPLISNHAIMANDCSVSKQNKIRHQKTKLMTAYENDGERQGKTLKTYLDRTK